MPPSVSIIVPVWNEGPLIGDFLRGLREAAESAEIILVNGGSRDGTISASRELVNRFLHVAGGRARQMNAGAAVAKGELLWFLHADSVIPRAALPALREALHDV